MFGITNASETEDFHITSNPSNSAYVDLLLLLFVCHMGGKKGYNQRPEYQVCFLVLCTPCLPNVPPHYMSWEVGTVSWFNQDTQLNLT